MALEEIIKDFRHKVIKMDFKKDVTYKYNRRVLGSSKIISPTYRQKMTKTEVPTIAFYIDVSGSMDTDLVDRVITTLRDKMSRINRSLVYNIITWDTELCEFYRDVKVNSQIPKLSCYGGTCLAGCFDHFKKEFDKSSVMVLISDFEDELRSWHEKEKDMNGYSMYGLDYGGSYRSKHEYESINWKNFKPRKCSN
jgi:predicted metal-dependent peptidase